MSAIRTLIADDEVLARRTIRELLAEVPDIAVVTECRDGLETAAAVAALEPELVFLDIHMPGLDGFRAIARAPRAPVIVFVTAYAQHAVQAFDADAADYLLKPFDDERFHRAVERARAEVARRRAAAEAPAAGTSPAAPAPPAPPAPPAAPARADRLVLRDGARIELVDPAEIDWIGADGYYAEVHTAARSSILLREPLQDLEQRLDPARFLRIHRSAIVNLERIARIERLGHGELAVVLRDGTRMRVARARRDELVRRVGAR